MTFSEFIDKYNWKLLLAFIAFLFLAVWGFTRSTFSFYNGFNYSNSGQIGDTIGGITAPFINLVAAILVYYSFKAQTDANVLQIKANDLQDIALQQDRDRNNDLNKFNQIVALIEDIKSEYNGFEVKVNVNEGTAKIPSTTKQIEAFKVIRNHFIKSKSPQSFFVTELYDLHEATESYFNLLKLVLYTAENIIVYPYNKDSQSNIDNQVYQYSY